MAKQSIGGIWIRKVQTRNGEKEVFSMSINGQRYTAWPNDYKNWDDPQDKSPAYKIYLDEPQGSNGGNTGGQGFQRGNTTQGGYLPRTSSGGAQGGNFSSGDMSRQQWDELERQRAANRRPGAPERMEPEGDLPF